MNTVNETHPAFERMESGNPITDDAIIRRSPQAIAWDVDAEGNDVKRKPSRPRRWFKMFAKPSPMHLAFEELENAQREHLAAQSAKEYAENMVKYHDARIKRLTAFINAETKRARTS